MGREAEDAKDAQDEEFDTYARWTREAIERLGPEVALPAACRGSGSPATLDWLLERLTPASDELLLDIGGGMGGPGAYAAGRAAVRVVVLDPAPEACATAQQIFGLTAVVSVGDRLPLRDHTARLAWSLGVLCTTDEQSRFLAESRRVVQPGGLLGLFVLVREHHSSLPEPEGNTFPTPAELGELLTSTGWAVDEEVSADDLDDSGSGRAWKEAERRVDDEVREVHGHHPSYGVVREQTDRISALLDSGAIRKSVMVCRGL